MDVDTSRSRSRHHSARWAAIGAAIAVSLGAGSIGLATKGSGERPVATSLSPCRLADTRPVFNVGPRATPLGTDDTHTIKVTGNSGECTGIPGDVTAVGLNVTAIDATRPTYLTIWPDGPRPNASSLNPAPGQPPAPNAVTVKLASDGTFSIYNLQGDVHLAVDLVAIYQHHHHDDRYHTKQQVDTALADKANASDVYTKTEVDVVVAPLVNSVAASASGNQNLMVEHEALVVRSVSLMPPADGMITVNSSNTVEGGAGITTVACSITTGTTLDNSHLQVADVSTDMFYTAMSGTRGFSVSEGVQFTANLVCEETFGGLASVQDSALTAIFTPT